MAWQLKNKKQNQTKRRQTYPDQSESSQPTNQVSGSSFLLWVSENYKDFKRLADELTAKEVRPNYDNCDIVIVFIKKNSDGWEIPSCWNMFHLNLKILLFGGTKGGAGWKGWQWKDHGDHASAQVILSENTNIMKILSETIKIACFVGIQTFAMRPWLLFFVSSLSLREMGNHFEDISQRVADFSNNHRWG